MIKVSRNGTVIKGDVVELAGELLNLADGIIKGDTYDAIMKFFPLIEAMNRELDVNELQVVEKMKMLCDFLTEYKNKFYNEEK